MNPDPARFVRDLLEGKPQALAIFGTSLSFHLAPVLRRAMEARFGNALKVANFGVSGRASRTALASLQNVMASKPDAILMEWAINDAHDFHHEPDALDAGITLDESRANLNELVSRIQLASPNTEILLWTTNPTFDTPTSSMRGASARPELGGYYRVVREVASARGLEVMDGENFWNSLRERDENEFRALLPDGVHPSPRAHREHLAPFLLGELGIPIQTL